MTGRDVIEQLLAEMEELDLQILQQRADIKELQTEKKKIGRAIKALQGS